MRSLERSGENWNKISERIDDLAHQVEASKITRLLQIFDLFTGLALERVVSQLYYGSYDNRTLYDDFRSFLTDNALLIADHLSVHYFVEVKSIFLHQEFVKFAFRIQFRYKLKRRTTKHILRKAYEGRLPRNSLRRKKHRVVAPLNVLFQLPLRVHVTDFFRRHPLNRNPSAILLSLNA